MINTSNYQNVLSETCQLLPRYIDKINSNIDLGINSISSEEEYNEDILRIFDNLSHFISIVSIIFRDKVWNNYDNQTMEILKTLKIHQLSIVKALKSAAISNDKLMLIDLLEYELKDNLTQWKISAIPQLKMAIKSQKSHNHTTF